MFFIVFIASNIFEYPVLSVLSCMYHLAFSILVISALASSILLCASANFSSASAFLSLYSCSFSSSSFLASLIFFLPSSISFLPLAIWLFAVFFCVSSSFFCFWICSFWAVISGVSIPICAIIAFIWFSYCSICCSAVSNCLATSFSFWFNSFSDLFNLFSELSNSLFASFIFCSASASSWSASAFLSSYSFCASSIFLFASFTNELYLASCLSSFIISIFWITGFTTAKYSSLFVTSSFAPFTCTAISV